ncbi:MAG: hypothetical protein J0H72_28770 [Burkholderiales bacterium]|nr:hypothetical protein [Burkholderiales bacterium]
MSSMREGGLCVGHFQSVPWIPFYVGSEDWPMRRVPCMSSTVPAMVDAGLLDATPMATVDWLTRGEQWPRLGGLGLAYRQRAGSVLLFSPRPIHELDGADIAICDETATSMRVLHAILAGKYGLRIGRWRRGLPTDPSMPRLLIQDQAVEEAARGRFPHVHDLGREWWEWQGTPVVSAVWVRRRDLADDALEPLRAGLAASLSRYASQPDQAIEHHCARHGVASAPAALRTLLGNFEFELGEAAEAGIRRMAQVLPTAVPLQA